MTWMLDEKKLHVCSYTQEPEPPWVRKVKNEVFYIPIYSV
jgi:hypothetical protein